MSPSLAGTYCLVQESLKQFSVSATPVSGIARERVSLAGQTGRVLSLRSER